MTYCYKVSTIVSMKSFNNKKISKFVLAIFSLSCFTILGVAQAGANKPLYSKEAAVKLLDVQYLTFLSFDVTVNGKPYLLASKKPISLVFEEKTISLGSGCNTLGGKYSISEGNLRSQTLFKTKKACSQKQFNQDLWLNQLFSSKPKITIQFISTNSKVRTPTTLLKVYSNLTPGLKAGNSIITMKVKESYGFADTPKGDENSINLVNVTCDQLLLGDVREIDAQFVAEQNALLFRVVSRDGENYAVTKDYRVNRMNVAILKGIVSECYQG